MTDKAAHVAVVVVNYRTPQLTIRCLDALRDERASVPNLSVIVVDGGSGDTSAMELAAALAKSAYRGWVSFLPLETNGGFGWANNQAILTLAKEKQPPNYIYLLNPDAEVCRGAVLRLVEALEDRPRSGAAGSQLLASNGHSRPSAFPFPSLRREFAQALGSERIGKIFGVGPAVLWPQEVAEVDWVTGASVMFRTDALRDVGLFDDGFFLYFEEVELMHRLRSGGWTTIHVPESRVFHLEGASTGVGVEARRRPVYWYRSRLHYFALVGGGWMVLAANLAAFGGRILAATKRIVGRPELGNPVRVGDLLQFGFWPSKASRRSSISAWNDLPGKPPAWMDRQ